MESLPIDLSHPAVRDYVALIRLQVLTPLSLLVNIATLIICTTVAKPSIGGISKLYPTSISPKPAVIAIYVIAIFAGQLGYCFLLVGARKAETKKTLTQGVGLSLVFANWVMALWAVTWIFEWFIASTILQGILLLLLLYSNVVLLIYHTPTAKRPLDALLIHAPLRFFLVLQLALMFPLSLLISLGYVYTPTAPGPPVDYGAHPWPGFGIVIGTNLLGTLVIILRRDFVWAVAATWISISIWTQRPKPAPVYITALVFTVLHPLTLLSVWIYSHFYQRRQIALPPGDEHPGLYRDPARTEPDTAPREVNADEVWS